MIWIKYAGIYVLLILLAFIIAGISSAKLQDQYFGKTNTKAMKGVAILAVMLCHLMGKFGGGTTLFTPLGGIGVSIFLMFSAYGLNESFIRGGYKFWWKKRIIAVFIPYFLIQCILYWPFQKFNIIDFILDVTLISPQYHNGWYLNYLLMCYNTGSVLDKTYNHCIYISFSSIIFTVKRNQSRTSDVFFDRYSSIRIQGIGANTETFKLENRRFIFDNRNCGTGN